MRIPAVLSVCLAVFPLGCGHGHGAADAQAETKAWRKLTNNASALSHYDVNGDGVADTVLVERVEDGFVASVHVSNPNPAEPWTTTCHTPTVIGQEIELFQGFTVLGRPHALLVAAEKDPDETQLSLVLFDPGQACAVDLSERLRFPKVSELIAPVGAPGLGVTVAQAGDALSLVDRPGLITLLSRTGEAALLTRVRVRHVHEREGKLIVDERDQSLISPVPVRASWQAGVEPAVELPELGDGDDSSGFVMRAGEVGQIHLEAAGPVSLIEVHHGCYGESAVALSIKASEMAVPYVLGSAPPDQSVIQAAGRSRGGELSTARDLVVLRQPVDRLTLEIGPAEAVRCLREIRAGGFVSMP